MEKATLGFRIYKIWQILKHFTGTFHRAQTLKLGGVNSDHIPLDQSEFPTSFENYIHSTYVLLFQKC